MHCSQCGREQSNDAEVCAGCGTVLARTESSPVEQAADGRLDTQQRSFWHTQLAARLASMFDTADPAVLAEFAARIELVSLRGGETLFRQGDPGDAAYFVISGRVRAVDDSSAQRTLNDMGVGETVGEMALLSSERRSATVYAVRDSLLGRLPAAQFHELIERHPRVLRRITALLVERLRRRNVQAEAGRAEPRTFAVVPISPLVRIDLFSRQLASALTAHGATLRVDAWRARQALGLDPGDELPGLNPQLVQWLNQQELGHRFVVYEAEPALSDWTQCALRQADHVLLVTDAQADPQPGQVERQLAAQWPGSRSPRRSLVLLRHGDAAPTGTAAFLQPRTVDCHYHVQRDRVEDFARLARCLTGHGIGLVLGGGGARGLAHLGVLRALTEAGVPVDWVGGTSSGAILATAAARRVAPDVAHAQCREYFAALRDPTLPVVALFAGRRIRANLERVLGGLAIEDLPLPYFCVSTNLSHAGQVVHERGSLVRAIRASISLPGILPPVNFDDDLHVDGGLVNNLPIDVMAAKPEIGAVLAVDVSPDIEMRAPPDLEQDASGWSLLWRRVRPWGPRRDLPSIMSLLTRSSVVASVYWARERRTADAASLYLRIPVADFRLLAFDRIDEIAQRGYQASRDAIRAWWERQRAAG